MKKCEKGVLRVKVLVTNNNHDTKGDSLDKFNHKVK